MEPRPELVHRIAARAHLEPDRVRDVLDALSHVEHEDAGVSSAHDEPAALLARASNHELGLPFLLEGNIEAVAITFRTHVFHVEEARRRIASDDPTG